MSRSYLSFYEPEIVATEEGPFTRLLTRSQVLDGIADRREFDLIVFGGSVAAVLVAHQAALHELRVAVISETSFGIESARCSSRELPYRYPLGLLTSYRRVRAFASAFDTAHLWTRVDATALRRFSLRSIPAAIFSMVMQWDRQGSMVREFDLGLFTREVGLAARQEGALIVSGVEGVFLEPEHESGAYRVGFKDRITGDIFEVRAGGVVIDCELGELPRTRIGTSVKRARAESKRSIGVTEESGVFLCTACAPWDALWCAGEIVDRVLAVGGMSAGKQNRGHRSLRPLAGAYTSEIIATFKARCRDAQISQPRIDQVLKRWQGRVRYFDILANAYCAVSAEALRGEIELAIRSDHAATVREVVEGSLRIDPSQLSAESLEAISLVCREFGLAPNAA